MWQCGQDVRFSNCTLTIFITCCLRFVTWSSRFHVYYPSCIIFFLLLSYERGLLKHTWELWWTPCTWWSSSMGQNSYTYTFFHDLVCRSCNLKMVITFYDPLYPHQYHFNMLLCDKVSFFWHVWEGGLVIFYYPIHGFDQWYCKRAWYWLVVFII